MNFDSIRNKFQRRTFNSSHRLLYFWQYKLWVYIYIEFCSFVAPIGLSVLFVSWSIDA